MSDSNTIKLIDHIGVDLWAAADAWKAAYTKKMVNAGHSHFGGAGAAILPYIGPKGARPSSIAKRLGVTRQAVQQLIDALERDGVVTRDTDPEDGRAKIVRLTDLGARAHWSGNIVKAEIESGLVAELGAERIETLKAELSAVTALLKGKTEPD